ncbi:MAG: hypothetical protein AB1Z22_02155 [Synechococcaceae cyanobacterium]
MSSRECMGSGASLSSAVRFHPLRERDPQGPEAQITEMVEPLEFQGVADAP